MEIALLVLLTIIGIVFLLVGLAGIVLPVIPDAPVIFVGMLILGGTYGFDRISTVTWILLGLLAVLMLSAELLSTMAGAKAVKASRLATILAGVGAILGFLAGSLPGLLIGPFIGAMLGEILSGRDAIQSAGSGAAAALGLLSGMFMKALIAGTMIAAFIIGMIW